MTPRKSLLFHPHQVPDIFFRYFIHVTQLSEILSFQGHTEVVQEVLILSFSLSGDWTVVLVYKCLNYLLLQLFVGQ